MVLLAAAVCTKGGKALVSRQFVEMTRARIEGLLAAFPKLMSTGRQHTFVETESVRYVYQPLDLLYMLLITTKASNILEDLETLRLFSRVVPEYCRSLDEKDISDNAFNLIFAFDEIVALGYRESVNLAQIRTFVEMDSHEEKVFRAVRETQEREAKTRMKEKAKELQRKRYEEMKRGGGKSGMGGGYGSNASSMGNYNSGNSGGFSIPAVPDNIARAAPEPRSSKVPVGGKAMKLGSRAKDVDSFVDALKSEGERISTAAVDDKRALHVEPDVHTEPVHILVCEDLTVHAGRDGGLRNLEVQGILKLRISSAEHGFIRVQVDNQEERGIQLQTHPNVDRELWRACSQVGMKQSNKPFPVNTDVGVVKWRFQTTDDGHIPLTINCWPQEDGSGNCDVNIEYTLEDSSLELNNVSISVPLCSGAPPPVVRNCDGTNEYDRSHSALVWNIPLLDASTPSGTLDFTARGSPDTFFPVTVSFTSTKTFCNLKVRDVVSISDGSSVNYSTETLLRTTSYQID
ncbi:coatomer subunit delta isoform X2 [Hyalella azteca]|uniref:Coatomer subunit delta n=1 Tax=Hyalella azteca TaxID=294128 RepID=A0A8B7PJR6_HYAAZ|nr:coatomer subunit delta isoform X2 [Hyalella azteca]